MIDFVVVQPNVIVRSSKTGEDELWSGSLAVKVELALKSPQQIQYELWAILRSTHGFAGCYIISASDVIKESYSEAWIDLIESRKIPYQLHDWLKFGKHQPLNSSTKVSVKHYSKPVNNQAAKTYING